MDTVMQLFERTKTEIGIGAVFSMAGACMSFLVGGCDAPLQALLVLVIADYLTGIFAACKTGTLSSNKGFHGMLRKIVIVAVVAFANMVDIGMGLNHLLRTMTICGYSGMEGLSLIENVDRAGYGDRIPEFLRNKVAQLREEKGVKM